MVMAAKGMPNRNTAKYNIEKQYICFINSEIISFSWNKSDVERFREMWNEGISAEDIAIKFERHPIDVAILIMDQAEQEEIAWRPTGIFGWRLMS